MSDDIANDPQIINPELATGQDDTYLHAVLRSLMAGPYGGASVSDNGQVNYSTRPGREIGAGALSQISNVDPNTGKLKAGVPGVAYDLASIPGALAGLFGYHNDTLDAPGKKYDQILMAARNKLGAGGNQDALDGIMSTLGSSVGWPAQNKVIGPVFKGIKAGVRDIPNVLSDARAALTKDKPLKYAGGGEVDLATKLADAVSGLVRSSKLTPNAVLTNPVARQENFRRYMLEPTYHDALEQMVPDFQQRAPMLAALGHYQGHGAETLNNLLRNGQELGEDVLRQHPSYTDMHRTLEDILASHPGVSNQMSLYRGIHTDPDAHLDDILSDPGYQSWSTNPRTALAFAGTFPHQEAKVLMRTINPNDPSLALKGRKMINPDDEAEVLLPPQNYRLADDPQDIRWTMGPRDAGRTRFSAQGLSVEPPDISEYAGGGSVLKPLSEFIRTALAEAGPVAADNPLSVAAAVKSGKFGPFQFGTMSENTPAYQKLLAQHGFDPKLHPDDFQALHDYSLGEGADDDRVAHLVNRYGLQLPPNRTLYRGESLDPGAVAELKPGSSSIVDRARSTSMSPDEARIFADSGMPGEAGVLHRLSPGPGKLLPLPISGQSEFLLPPGKSGAINLKSVLRLADDDWGNQQYQTKGTTGYAEGGAVTKLMDLLKSSIRPAAEAGPDTVDAGRRTVLGGILGAGGLGMIGKHLADIANPATKVAEQAGPTVEAAQSLVQPIHSFPNRDADLQSLRDAYDKVTDTFVGDTGYAAMRPSSVRGTRQAMASYPTDDLKNYIEQAHAYTINHAPHLDLTDPLTDGISSGEPWSEGDHHIYNVMSARGNVSTLKAMQNRGVLGFKGPKDLLMGQRLLEGTHAHIDAIQAAVDPDWMFHETPPEEGLGEAYDHYKSKGTTGPDGD
jgi:hypothetical protein